jgi:hypothetical protein
MMLAVCPPTGEPFADADVYEASAGTPLTVAPDNGLLANDCVGDGKTLSATLTSAPTHGALTLNADGSFVYTPDPTYTGMDSFSYSASDGATSSNVASVEVEVLPPLNITITQVATNRTLAVVDLAVDAPLFIDASTGGDDNVLSFSPGLAGGKIVQTAKADRTFGQNVTVHDPNETYVRFTTNQSVTVFVGYHPDMAELPEWLEQDRGWRATGEELRSEDFRYVVLEKSFTAGEIILGHNPSHHSTFIPGMYTVVVTPDGDTPTNNHPYANHDVYDLAGASALAITPAEGVLANDDDVEGDVLSATIVQPPLFGTVALASDGSFSYAPGANFTRWDSFQYQVSDGTDSGNTTIVTILNGQPLDDPGHPHTGDEPRANEHLALLALVPRHAATHIAATSGNWSDPATWQNGLRPIDNANVLIPAGITITVDGQFAETLRTIRVDGVLRFSPTVNASLRADTTVIDPAGRFEMGTAAAPIASGMTAKLMIADRGPVDLVWDPFGISRGYISHGTTSIHGQAATPFLKLTTAPRAGDTQLTLESVPTNWKVGDELVVAGTSTGTAAAMNNESDVVTIQAISGNVVTVTPLAHNHFTPGPDCKVHVAHLTRNAVIESENPDISARGHAMFMHNAGVDVQNAGFYHVGRTDKKVRANDPIVVHDGTLVPGRGTNPRGRYGVHFHRTGVVNTVPASRVSGSVITDSLGWGFVNHSSFVEFTDNVAYDVDGAAFVTETGDEIGTFARNIAIFGIGSGAGLEARNDIQDFGHQGDGFWFQGGGVHVVDNVAAAQREQGFIFFTEGLRQPGLGTTRFVSANLPDRSITTNTTINVINTPIFEFSGNESYGTRDGLHTQYHLLNPSHTARSTIADFTAWNVTNGINSPYTRHTDYRNIKLINDVNTPRSEGYDTNDVTEDIRFYDPTIIGFNDGIEVPKRGSNLISGGFLQNRNNIEMDIMRERDRSLTITGNTVFRMLPPSVTGQKYNIFMQQPLAGDEESFEHVFRSEALYIDNGNGNIQQVWSPEQAADFIPFPTAQTGLPPEYVGLTNQQLFDQFGVAVGGEVAPANAFSIPGIRGLVTSIPYFVQPSEAVDDFYLAYQGSDRTVSAGQGLLSNDYDLVSPTLTAAIFAQPSSGTVTVQPDGSFIYTPSAGFTGADTFTYQASNGVYTSDPAIVTVMVRPQLDITIDAVSTRKPYDVVDLAVGAEQYIDRDYIVTAYSSGLQGGKLIRGAEDDDTVTAVTHLTLSVDEPVVVYLGYNRRTDLRPAWLTEANGWTPSTQTLRSDFSAGNPTYIMYQKSFPAGQIVLGGPHPGQPVDSPAHYVTIVTPAPVAGDITSDGFVDRKDLAQLVKHLGTNSGSHRFLGDLNGDGRTSLADLAMLQGHFTTPTSPAPAAVIANAAPQAATAADRLSPAPVDRVFAEPPSDPRRLNTRIARKTSVSVPAATATLTNPPGATVIGGASRQRR